MEVKAQRDETLKQLYQQVQNSGSVFLSPEDLQTFGIQASEVGIIEDGTLQFNPCFFRPYPERVLEKYPIDPQELPSIDTLNNRPDWEAIYELMKNGPLSKSHEEAVEYANFEVKDLTEEEDDRWYLKAARTHRHIDGQILAANRKGRDDVFGFYELGPSRLLWRYVNVMF